MIPTSIQSVENILDLNNHAVSFLCQGNHSATATALRTAIRNLESCFQRQKTCQSPPPSSSCEPPKKRRRRTSIETVSTTPAAAATASTQVKQQKKQQPHQGKNYYVPIRSITVSGASSSDDLPSASSLNDETSLLMVYNNAFDFPSYNDDSCVDFTSQQSKTRLAAILLYNLGLSYHREGLRSGKSADLNMALKFYREAYMVLKSAWARSDFQEVFVLLLALLNNMACIHAYMSDCKDTHQCIEWMNRAIASRQRSILSKEDYTFFSLNLSVFRGHQLRLASAA